MALFFLQNLDAKTSVGTRQVVVAAETAADARAIASAYQSSDSGWSGATTTALVDTATWAGAGAATGWTFKVQVSGAAGQTPTADPLEVSVTGDADDALDDIGTKLAAALNATVDIANAAYAAPNLTVAGVADAIGDAQVYLVVTPPTGDTDLDLSSLLIGAGGITDGGIAGAALTIAFIADSEIKPTVLAEAV